MNWNFVKAAWNKSRNYIDEHVAAVQEEENILHKCEKNVMLINEAAKESIPK